MNTPNAPLHRPVSVRAACCVIALVLLSVLTTACAQETPPPAPEDTREWPRRFDGLVSADDALDRIEADLDAGRSAGTPKLFRSISANGDSARHFDRTLRLTRLFAARNDEVGASRMLVALWAMGAQRPFFRAIVFDAARDHVMATAAMRVLAYDPRQQEYDEFAAFRAALSPNPSTQGAFGVGSPETLNEIITEYGSFLGVVEAYEEIRTVRGKLDFLDTSIELGGWYESQFRALYVAHPAEVEAWISSLVIAPPDPLSPIPQPPDRVIRRDLLDVAQAPSNVVLPPTIEGPLLPASPLTRVCNGRPATVYVSPAGLVVGGPLDGQPYAGRLVGTDGPDVILGTAAADVLEGLYGDDALCAAAGDDALAGGDGTDTADGGAGTDGCDVSGTATACEGSIPRLTSVRPFAECVTPPGRDGSFTAVFGYENLSGQVGRVPAGDDNRLDYVWRDGNTGEVKEGTATEVFALPTVVPGHPGQTPPGRRAAFSVPVPPDATSCGYLNCPPQAGSITWTLLGQSATASPRQTPLCPAP